MKNIDMVRKGVIGSVCGAVLAAALYAAACDFQKAINPGQCAAVPVCTQITPTAPANGGAVTCGSANTTPVDILRACGASGDSNSNYCYGASVICYYTTTCTPVRNPPPNGPWVCVDDTPGTTPSNAINNTTRN